MENFEVLFASEKSEFKKIAYFFETENYWKVQKKLVIVWTKEELELEEMKKIADYLIEYQIVKEEFYVYNVFINPTWIKLWEWQKNIEKEEEKKKAEIMK